MLCWPLAVLVGRRYRYAMGVPAVPKNRFLYDYPNVDPSHNARKRFYIGFATTAILGGMAFASNFTYTPMTGDAWRQRPDHKPYPAMVAKESMSDQDRQVFEQYWKYAMKRNTNDRKKQAWYRLLFPNSADWTFIDNSFMTK